MKHSTIKEALAVLDDLAGVLPSWAWSVDSKNEGRPKFIADFDPGAGAGTFRIAVFFVGRGGERGPTWQAHLLARSGRSEVGLSRAEGRDHGVALRKLLIDTTQYFAGILSLPPLDVGPESTP